MSLWNALILLTMGISSQLFASPSNQSKATITRGVDCSYARTPEYKKSHLMVIELWQGSKKLLQEQKSLCTLTESANSIAIPPGTPIVSGDGVCPDGKTAVGGSRIVTYEAPKLYISIASDQCDGSRTEFQKTIIVPLGKPFDKKFENRFRVKVSFTKA